jgi:hypothetical protein
MEHQPIVDYLRFLADGAGDATPFYQLNRLWGPRLWKVVSEFPEARLHFHYREDADAQWESYQRVFPRRPDFFGEVFTWLRRTDPEVLRWRGYTQFARVRQACVDDTAPRADLTTTYEELLARPEETFAKMLAPLGSVEHSARLAEMVEVMRHG